MTTAFYRRLFEIYLSIIRIDNAIPEPFKKDATQDMVIRSWRTVEKQQERIRNLYGYCRRLYVMERQVLQQRYRPVYYDYIEDYEIFQIQGFLPTDADSDMELAYADILRELDSFTFPVYLDDAEGLADSAARYLRGEHIEDGAARVLGRIAAARCLGAGRYLAKQARQEWADAVFALHGTG